MPRYNIGICCTGFSLYCNAVVPEVVTVVFSNTDVPVVLCTACIEIKARQNTECSLYCNTGMTYVLNTYGAANTLAYGVIPSACILLQWCMQF